MKILFAYIGDLLDDLNSREVLKFARQYEQYNRVQLQLIGRTVHLTGGDL